MVAMRFWIEGEHEARVEVAPPYTLVGVFIEADVQWNLRETRELRQMVADYREGRRSDPSQSTGNAFTLYLRPDGAYIELAVSEDFEPNAEVPLEVLDQALAGWERLLEQVWDYWEEHGLDRRPDRPGWERRPNPPPQD